MQQTVVRQDDYTSLFNGITLATGIKTASIYKFEECTDQNGVANVGHYLTLQTQLQYENAGGNTNTMGVLAIQFDVVQLSEDYQRTRSDEIEFAYTASE